MFKDDAELGEVLSKVDLSGFTHLVRGTLGRYVIGCTHNTERTLQLLNAQLNYYGSFHENLTIGGWLDQSTNQIVVDVGTTTDSFIEAAILFVEYNQKCIRDTYDQCEIVPVLGDFYRH